MTTKTEKAKRCQWRWLLGLVVLLTGAFSSADAQNTWTSGECTVAVNGGSLNVTKASGDGRMADYDVQDGNEPGWYETRNQVSVIVIEDGVTSIGADCFRDFEKATIVILSEGLTSIGKESFAGCASLGSITIPSTVTNIGPDAFYLCHPSLLNVYCYADPAKLTWIDNGSNDFVLIGTKSTACHVRGADLATYKAKFADVNITFLGDLDYKDDSWQSGDCWVTLDDDGTLTVTKMEGGEGRMDDYQDYRRSPWYKYAAKVKSLVIGEGVTVIGQRAFEECVNLETVTLPEGVTTIEYASFKGCTGLKTVTIPSTVTKINLPFEGCPAVDDLYLYPLPTELDEWWMIDSELKADKGTRCHVKAGYQRTYESTYAQHNVTFVGDLPDDDPGLAIDATNFPDANFRQLIHDLPENNGDDYLSYDEISSIEELYATGYEIKDLKGVEHFRELKLLFCGNNQLTTLNLSGNTKLESLRCGNNQLTTLRLSACTKLNSLDCSHNQLTTLDVSQNPLLTNIECTFNQIKGLGMDAFASSLRADGGQIHLLAEKDPDGNALTLNQLKIIRGKGWTVYYQKASSEFDWIVYEGEQYTIFIVDTQVTDMNKDDVLGDGSVKYEPGDGVGILTFTGNKLTAPDNKFVITAQGVDLVINAPEDGLTLESQYGIDMRGNNLTVNGDITFKTEFNPVYSCADFIVNGDLTASNINVQNGTIIVNGNTKMTADTYSTCLSATSVVLNGAKHELSGGACIRATNVTIAGDLTATASGDCAIWANDNLTVASGTWTVSAKSTAIRSGKKFTIPDTHGIKTPVLGKIIQTSSYLTVWNPNTSEYNPGGAKEVEIVDYPCLYLSEYEYCSSQLSAADGQEGTVAIVRNIKKNGWNTFAAPIAITDLEGTFGQGVKVKQLTGSSLIGGTLKLTFTDADRIEPGKPYLVRVKETVNLKGCVFEGVTISKDIVPTVTDAVDLVPTLGRTTVEGDNPKSVMVFYDDYYGLVFAQELPALMNGFRAYFRLKDPDAVRSISMSLDDDGGATLVNSVGVRSTSGRLLPEGRKNSEQLADEWYTVDGRKLSGQPTAKGVYINKGKKTIIK